MQERLVVGEVARAVVLVALVLVGAADADDRHRDAQPHADRGQRGAGPGLVPSQVAQRQPGRDRRRPAIGGSSTTFGRSAGNRA